MITFIFLFVASATAQSNPWSELSGPLRGADDKMEIVGFYSNGCIRNAREIAVSNRYWEIVNTSRHRNYGHSDMVGFLNYLGEWSVTEA